jgi:GWxTD domain-containing protein
MVQTLVVSMALGLVQAPDQPGLELRAVRFYRGAGAQTLVDAFSRVPFTLLDPLKPGPDGVAVYRFAVAVRDSAGLELLSRSWTQAVPARLLTVAQASAVEHFSFAAKAGRYSVEVAVTDSATGRIRRQSTEVHGFPGGGGPAASDLLLAMTMRPAGGAGAGDTVPQPGEVRKGALFLQASGRPALTPQQARLGYYLEVYRARPETVTVAARVLTGAGAQLVATSPQRVPVAQGGGVLNGTLDLAGLPPGDYRLSLAVTTADSTIERGAEFHMTGFEAEAAIAAAAPVRDVFGALAEAQLDTLYLPLVYLMTGEEQGIYPTLSLDGKRNWLRQFWQKRDPTPGTPGNEAQDDFYTRIAEANRRYREGGAAQIPGWRTDRGRIFIKYGPPDEKLERPQAGSTAPYEAWKYTRGRSLKYVFLDVTRFGNYVLIYTTDRRESSRPNWEALLGPEAVVDVQRF